HDLNSRHVPGINLEIQTQLLTQRRHAQASNDRKPLPAVTVPQHRRPSQRRPSAQHWRNEHKPALIDENQMRAQPPGFFLYAATRAASTVGFFWGRAGWPGARASGSSSPKLSEFSKRAPDDRRCPNACGFARQRDESSTSRWDNPPLSLLVLAVRSISASGGVAVVGVGRA